MAKKSKWAIRDIVHGKTFFFDSYDQMVAWIHKNSQSVLPLLSTIK